MKAHYVSTLSHRVVQRSNGTYRVQEFNPKLARDTGEGILRGRKDCDPWENISPALSREEALAVLRRYEHDKGAHSFFDRNGHSIRN